MLFVKLTFNTCRLFSFVCSEMTQALQATVVCLKEENSSLMEQLSSERKLASDSTEDTLSLKGLLEREREAMSEAREEIQQLKDSIKQLESAAEQMKVCACVCLCMHTTYKVAKVCMCVCLPCQNHLQNMKEDSSKSIEVQCVHGTYCWSCDCHVTTT